MGSKWSKVQPDSNRSMSSAAFHTASMSSQEVDCGEVLKAKRTFALYYSAPAGETASLRTTTDRAGTSSQPSGRCPSATSGAVDSTTAHRWSTHGAGSFHGT